MNSNVKIGIFAIAGIIIGLILAFAIMWNNSAQSVMMMEDESKYSFDQAVSVFEQKAIADGWKIPTVHDLQLTMEKFGKNVKKVKVFELCHPEHAYKILSQSEERVVSSLMPCRVAIYEKDDGKTYVSRMNTGLLGKMMSGVVPEVMEEASAQSENIVKSILK